MACIYTSVLGHECVDGVWTCVEGVLWYWLQCVYGTIRLKLPLDCMYMHTLVSVAVAVLVCGVVKNVLMTLPVQLHPSLRKLYKCWPMILLRPFFQGSFNIPVVYILLFLSTVLYA